MTFIPLNENINCDCLQPHCPYCDPFGERAKDREDMLRKIVFINELQSFGLSEEQALVVIEWAKTKEWKNS